MVTCCQVDPSRCRRCFGESYPAPPGRGSRTLVVANVLVGAIIGLATAPPDATPGRASIGICRYLSVLGTTLLPTSLSWIDLHHYTSSKRLSYVANRYLRPSPSPPRRRRGLAGHDDHP